MLPVTLRRAPLASRPTPSNNITPRRCRAHARACARARDHTTSAWRPISVLDEWVSKEARPISLRQLMVFGRSLTESRLINSANYVRTELPTRFAQPAPRLVTLDWGAILIPPWAWPCRIAHRIRDMQHLPYAVVKNPHISDVYNLYHNAFDSFRKMKEIKTLEENDALCKTISENLKAHLTVIPKLAMGIIECSDLMDSRALDQFMNTILRSRISRRVIAEQHLALTETFNSPYFSPGSKLSEADFIGEIFIKCIARDVISRCGRAVQALARSTYGESVPMPEITIEGHLSASFPYILNHLEYIIGELLRNSVRAVVERHIRRGGEASLGPPPPIEVTICESAEHIIIRISDQGGGIPRDVLPHLWSFSKGPYGQKLLENLGQVPKMAATMQELHIDDELGRADLRNPSYGTSPLSPLSQPHLSSLSSLTKRPPNLQLGMGLPLSRVYAEYWAGSLELHSLEGYGVDTFLQISRLGNKNEQLATRASMDAV
ncbi:related to branched-chain alpha-ketoacid dehydrogenase kinase [Cephalotrichum gorgonifer]|uniref:Protein-serine/threonine kinase n=1 Tax=Cephalotrichum gorgonifer TaxID=2041049 RepID=A0AAE8MP92_9PEZI|nr:related to branched-chain alpha-ketoacid dehydrogenase kinase [Cephalotrichum gorgonifer]